MMEKDGLFEAYGYSDDVVHVTGIEESSPSDGVGKWYAFFVDKVRVGRCRMDYADSAWTFTVECDEGHTVTAHKLKRGMS